MAQNTVCTTTIAVRRLRNLFKEVIRITFFPPWSHLLDDSPVNIESLGEVKFHSFEEDFCLEFLAGQDQVF